jgi:hypothetical protein
MIIREWKEGAQCSPNFKLKKKVINITQLMDILENQPSIYWNHRPYPCAVVIQQKLIVLDIAMKFGRIWEIEKI